MTTDQENEWFSEMGLDPLTMDLELKIKLKQTHSFAFYKMGCEFQELKKAIYAQLKRASTIPYIAKLK